MNLAKIKWTKIGVIWAIFLLLRKSLWNILTRFLLLFFYKKNQNSFFFQTGVSEFCLSKNRLVRWSMTSSEILKWGKGWISHNNDTSVPCRSWKIVPTFKFRESKVSQIKAQGWTGLCSRSFWNDNKFIIFFFA